MSNLIFHLTLELYEELVMRSKEAGIAPGSSMESILREMIKEGKIPVAIQTGRSKEQIIKDISNHWKILDLREVKND